MSTIERKFVDLRQLKMSDAGPGTIEGYRSVAGVIDEGGDIVVNGAFADCLDEYLSSGFSASSHSWSFEDSIGFPVEAREDQHGFFVKSQFHSTQAAQDVRTIAKERLAAGKTVGFSFGYRADGFEFIQPQDFKTKLPLYLKPERLTENLAKAQRFSQIRILKKVSVIEDSLVTAPMNKLATATSAKSGAFDDRIVIHYGRTVKDLGQGRFGGYAITFSNALEPDLQDDFFTPHTDLQLEDRTSLPLFFSHGVDPQLKGRQLGKVSFKVDDIGLWTEGQLALHDKWLEKIYQLIKDGILGFSTGAVSHLVERIARRGTAKVYELLRWPIGECSLTACPAEPRNEAIALKHFQSEQPSLKELYRRSQQTPEQREVERLYKESMEVGKRAEAALAPSMPDSWADDQAGKRARLLERVDVRLTAKEAREELAKVQELKASYEKLIGDTQDARKQRAAYNSELWRRYSGYKYASLEVGKAMRDYDYYHKQE